MDEITINVIGLEIVAIGYLHQGSRGSWEEPGEEPFFEIVKLTFVDAKSVEHDVTYLLDSDLQSKIDDAATKAAVENKQDWKNDRD